VTRINQLFAIERDIDGRSADQRRAVRQERSAPILAELEPWLQAQRDRVSGKSEVGKAIAYTLKRWTALARFLTDGCICLSTDGVEKRDRAQLTIFAWPRRVGGRSFHATTIRS
jgi:transposase